MEPVQEVNTDVEADSSPVIVETATPGPTKKLGEMSDAERLEWRKTGTVPKASAVPASPAAAPADQAVSTETTKPASEPGDYKTKTAARISELLETSRKETDRANRLERELAALRQPRVDVKPAASSTATTGDDPEPDPTTYEDLTKYLKDQSAWTTRHILKTERAEIVARTQAAHLEAQTTAKRAELAAKWESTATKHADFLTVATGPTSWAEGSATDAFILEAENGFDVLYYLQKHPAEATRIDAMVKRDGTPDGVKQLTALALISEKMNVTPTVKLVSTPPDSGPVLGVRSGDTTDAVTRAVRKKDYKGYAAEMNRAEMAAKGH